MTPSEAVGSTRGTRDSAVTNAFRFSRKMCQMLQQNKDAETWHYCKAFIEERKTKQLTTCPFPKDQEQIRCFSNRESALQGELHTQESTAVAVSNAPDRNIYCEHSQWGPNKSIFLFTLVKTSKHGYISEWGTAQYEIQASSSHQYCSVKGTFTNMSRTKDRR